MNGQGNLEASAIMNIQKHLRHLSFHNEEIGALPIDGIWESQTRDAVIAFQKIHGLSPTGIVDRETWDKLKEEYDSSVARNSPPVALDIFPRLPRDYEMQKGEEGFLVDVVQHMLTELEAVYNFDYMPTGIFDDSTMAIVRDFQIRNNIPPSGNITRETWDAMAVQYNLLY